jgi:hypothetical protein
MTFLFWEHRAIKLLNMAGQKITPYGEEVLMSSLETFCFGNFPEGKR